MKFVKISQKELKGMAKFYEGVMATAYEGLFYREGKVIGKGIIEVLDVNEDFMDRAEKLVKARGWVESLALSEDSAVSEGGIEVNEDSSTKTCHRLRGIISTIYEKKTGNMVDVKETACQSLGDDKCEFEVEVKGY